MFQRNVLSPSSRLKVGTVCFSESLVTTQHRNLFVSVFSDTLDFTATIRWKHYGREEVIQQLPGETEENQENLRPV